jgi:hypothetical protein
MPGVGGVFALLAVGEIQSVYKVVDARCARVRYLNAGRRQDLAFTGLFGLFNLTSI